MAHRDLLRPATAICALVSASCASVVDAPTEGPLALRVDFVGTVDGLDAAAPRPFSSGSVDLDVRVTVLGRDGEEDDGWDGTVQLRTTVGALRSSPNLVIEDGVGQAQIEVGLAFGAMRIWATHEGTLSEPGSYATGVSPAIHFERPTLAQVQDGGGVGPSPLENTYVDIKGSFDPFDPRDLVVTAITNDGFYVSDQSDPVGSWNNLFVFSFSRPDGLALGDRLGALSGVVDEFLGFTELGFPTWTVDANDVEVAAPATLDPSILCDDDAMEMWESAVVKIVDVRTAFSGLGDCEDYNTYGQWPAEVAGTCDGSPATINVVNVNTVPSFTFPECADYDEPAVRELRYLVGTIRHVEAADPPWVLLVRDCLDFPEENRPADCAALLRRPRSGPSLAPERFFRAIPTCEGVPW